MHPRMTHRQAEAHDAFEHIFASAGALAFINAYAGSAALPAPYNALAARQLACPCSHSSTLEEITHDTCSPRSFVAFVGIDWADAQHDVCLQTADATKRAYFQLEHTPAAIDAWGTTRRTRFTGPPVAMCLELNKGPLVSAWRQYDFLVLFPINPLRRARYREAHAQPGQRRPDGRRPPARTAAHPSRQARSLSGRRAPPCAPSHSSSSTVAVWSVTQCGSPTACPVPQELFSTCATLVAGARHHDLLRLPASLADPQGGATRASCHPCNLLPCASCALCRCHRPASPGH